MQNRNGSTMSTIIAFNCTVELIERGCLSYYTSFFMLLKVWRHVSIIRKLILRVRDFALSTGVTDVPVPTASSPVLRWLVSDLKPWEPLLLASSVAMVTILITVKTASSLQMDAIHVDVTMAWLCAPWCFACPFMETFDFKNRWIELIKLSRFCLFCPD